MVEGGEGRGEEREGGSRTGGVKQVKPLTRLPLSMTAFISSMRPTVRNSRSSSAVELNIRGGNGGGSGGGDDGGGCPGEGEVELHEKRGGRRQREWHGGKSRCEIAACRVASLQPTLLGTHNLSKIFT